MTHTRIRTGVVGFGMSARVFHLPFITTLPGFHLQSILERSKSEASARYPTATIHRHIDDMVADPNIDLLVITTPNDTHFPYAYRALQAGKHVVLEKPFTIHSSEAAELVQLSRDCGKCLSVYHNRRYVSDFRTIAALLAENKLGDIHEYECHFDRYRPEAKPQAWRELAEPGSGILYDLGSHLIDQALCLFGLPHFITADIKLMRPHAVTDDYFDIRLDYAFARIILKGSMLVREMGPRYMVHGMHGSYIKHGDDPQEALLKEGHLPNTPNWGMEPEHMRGLLHTQWQGEVIRQHIPTLPGNFGDFYNNLHAHIANGMPLQELAAHGYNSTRLIELALQSSSEGRKIACTELMDVSYPSYVQIATGYQPKL